MPEVSTVPNDPDAAPDAAASLPPVLVSVLNWNTPEQTLACLRAVRAQTYANTRFVVVDNASRDDSVARIAAEFPDTPVLRQAENLGYAAGHECALRHARAGDAAAMWLLNSDAVAEPDALAALVRAWQENGDAIYGGTPLRGVDDDGMPRVDLAAKFLSPGHRPRAFDEEERPCYDADWRRHALRRVGAVSGSSLFVPVALVDAHGWMDTDWFLYCEEVDWCYRLRRRGVPSYLVTTSRVAHRAEGSQRDRTRVASAIRYYHARNEIVLAQRHGNAAAAALIALKKLARALVISPTDPFRARCIARGVVDAMLGRMGRRVLPDDYLP